MGFVTSLREPWSAAVESLSARALTKCLDHRSGGVRGARHSEHGLFTAVTQGHRPSPRRAVSVTPIRRVPCHGGARDQDLRGTWSSDRHQHIGRYRCRQRNP
jgi:hypothetical protein